MHLSDKLFENLIDALAVRELTTTNYTHTQTQAHMEWFIYLGMFRIEMKMDAHTHTSTQPKLLTMLSNVGPSPIDVNRIWLFFLRKEWRRCIWDVGRANENGYTLTVELNGKHENQEKWNLKIQQGEREEEDNENSIAMMNLPVRKLTTISIKNIVSLRQLNAIHLVLKSSLKKDIATGSIIKLATNNSSIQRSQ